MRRRVAVAVVLLLGTTASARPFAGADRSPPAPEYQISGLRAQLFYSDRGTFSDDLLARPKLALWNTVIGAGDAGGPANATMVVVEVSGRPNSYAGKRRVELVVRNEQKDVLRRQLAVPILGRTGHAYVAFWLDDTGCEPLTLSTRLVGQSDPTSRVASIPFQCGE